MITKHRLLSGMILIALILSGCHTPAIAPVQENPVEEVDNTPKNGGKITLASRDEIALDPLQCEKSDGKSPSNLVFDGLVKIDGEGKIKPSLANSWEISADGRVYSFQLREDVKWHDGKTLVSADVVGTFEKIMELKKQKPKPGEPPVFQEFDNVESYAAPDENTFVVSLYKPDADFLFDMIVGILPSPKEISEEEVPGAVAATKQFLGTGPFKVAEITSASVLLRKNEDYFGPEPHIDEIEIRYYPDEYTAKEAFKSSEVDLIGIDPQDWGVFQNLPQTYLLQSPSRYFEFMALNLRNPFFSDVKVRRAVLLAIDREKMLQETFLGRGMVVDSPILPFSWAFNSQIEHAPFDPSEASMLLEEAGWKDEDGDGMLEKIVNGKKVQLEFQLLVNMSNATRYSAASQIEKSLKDVGISVKLVNVPWKELEKSVMKKQFDAAMMGWKLAPNPDLRFMFSSSEIKSGYNFVSYSNPELDEILIKAQAASTEERAELLLKAQEILSQDAPYVFLYSPNDLWAINARVKGIRPNPVNLYDNIHEWWIDEAQ